MPINTKKLNAYIMKKLPSAWLCGVRIKSLEGGVSKTTVKANLINKNPFGSIYFAVQSMAAELSTGALVMAKIKSTDSDIGILVTQVRSVFHKQAKSAVSFTCVDAHLAEKAVDLTIENGEAQRFWMKATGLNQTGELVSEFEIEWSVKSLSPMEIQTP